MNGRQLALCLALAAGLAPTACRQTGRTAAGDANADATAPLGAECPKVGGAVELPDSGWTLKLVSFRFFRDIGTDADVVRADEGQVFALAEVEWSRSPAVQPGESAGNIPSPSPRVVSTAEPPRLSLWDGKGNAHALFKAAQEAFLRMQPEGRYGILLGGPAERFLDAVVFQLPPEAARHGLWLAPEAPVPPSETQLRFCLGPYDVR